MSQFICQACTQLFPTVLLEVHHRYPREYGCPPYLDDIDHPDNLLDLCEHCHSLVHKIAAWAIKGKSGESLLDAIYLGKPYAQQAIANTLAFAQTIVQAEKHRQDSGEAHRQNSNIQIPLDFEFYNLEVKLAAKACKTSVARFMIDAIVNRTIAVNGPSARLSFERLQSGEKVVQTVIRTAPVLRRK